MAGAWSVLLILLGLCGAYGGRPVPSEVDAILETINSLVEAAGTNYLRTASTISFSDATLSGIRVGELSTWQWTRCPVVKDKGLGGFSVEASFGLCPLQFLVDSLSVGPYNGSMSMIVLDNSVLLHFDVEERFGPGCRAVVDRLELEDFDQMRFHAEAPLLPADFQNEKYQILNLFGAEFFNPDRFQKIRTIVEQVLNSFFCPGNKDVLSVISTYLKSS
ncbi:hypothetical protein AAG570_011713 [Ranatra chinensis]|uniref:Secreted protein n=1 Tax=Ranatra chinensis TaxID=642074 RepID=A0ABD0YGW1_9HEMI